MRRWNMSTKRLSHISLFFIPLFLLMACADDGEPHMKQPELSADHDWSVEEILQKYDQFGMLSGSLLIRRRGAERYWGYGKADDSTKEAITRPHVFLIASLSKSFVSAAILKLKDQGKLKLEDPISKYLPDLPAATLSYQGRMNVTITHLLHHTSGMPDSYEVPPVSDRIDRTPVEFIHFVEGLKGKELAFEPGKTFAYSNTGYVLLGEIVHRVAGENYSLYLKRELLDPMGLSNTTVGPPKDPSAKIAYSYFFDPLGRIDYRKKLHLNWMGVDECLTDLNIYTNVDDLAAWAKELTTGKRLSEESTKQMLTPNLDDYGFGWGIRHDSQGRLKYSHGGDFDGYQSSMAYYPEEDMTVIWLSNQFMSPVEQLDQFAKRIGDAAFKLQF